MYHLANVSMACYLWWVLLSLGTILEVTAYPTLTLNILCEDGPNFHTALSITQFTFSKHCKKKKINSGVARFLMLWWWDCLGQHWVLLALDHSVPHFWRRTYEFYQPKRVTTHQLIHCNCRAQILLSASQTSADMVTKSMLPSSCSCWAESTSNISWDMCPTAWERAVRTMFFRWKQNCGNLGSRNHEVAR